jgi:hypothetical protein
VVARVSIIRTSIHESKAEVQDACESAGQFPQGTAHPDEPGRAQNREQRKTTDMSAFYEGLYLIRVLADRELPSVDGPNSMIELLKETIDGDFVGDLVFEKVVEVNPAAMEHKLWEAGSEPGFFQLGDTLQVAEELFDDADDTGCSGDVVVVSKSTLNELLQTVGSDKRFPDHDDEDEQID